MFPFFFYKFALLMFRFDCWDSQFDVTNDMHMQKSVFNHSIKIVTATGI